MMCVSVFFNDTATTEIYTLSLHDALPIFRRGHRGRPPAEQRAAAEGEEHAGGAEQVVEKASQEQRGFSDRQAGARSEEHTSELQSRQYLVCRLLLEKKKNSYSVDPRSPMC